MLFILTVILLGTRVEIPCSAGASTAFLLTGENVRGFTATGHIHTRVQPETLPVCFCT